MSEPAAETTGRLPAVVGAVITVDPLVDKGVGRIVVVVLRVGAVDDPRPLSTSGAGRQLSSDPSSSQSRGAQMVISWREWTGCSPT